LGGGEEASIAGDASTFTGPASTTGGAGVVGAVSLSGGAALPAPFAEQAIKTRRESEGPRKPSHVRALMVGALHCKISTVEVGFRQSARFAAAQRSIA